MFPILSHFDIKRDYNPATGEQTNVIIENTIDRPWHERDYVRVDWSSSQVDAQQFGGKPRWGQKTPNNLYFVPQIRECFPDAQFICITRDGRDSSAISIESAFGAGNIYMAAYTWDAAM